VEGEGRGDSHLARARIDTSIWAGFLVGAALSRIVRSHFRLWALVPPCLVMIGLGLFSEPGTPSPEKRITPSMRGLAAQR
jgi:uncharacterized membrane protein YoaK (UPF0700 family)